MTDAHPATDPVQDYLDAVVDPDRAQVLTELRKQILRELPGARPVISYNLPAFAINVGTEQRPAWKVVCGFATTAKGWSFYPFSGTVVEEFADRLAGFGTTKGSIHLTVKKPLPNDLLTDIISYRVQEIANRGR